MAMLSGKFDGLIAVEGLVSVSVLPAVRTFVPGGILGFPVVSAAGFGFTTASVFCIVLTEESGTVFGLETESDGSLGFGMVSGFTAGVISVSVLLAGSATESFFGGLSGLVCCAYVPELQQAIMKNRTDAFLKKMSDPDMGIASSER